MLKKVIKFQKVISFGETNFWRGKSHGFTTSVSIPGYTVWQTGKGCGYFAGLYIYIYICVVHVYLVECVEVPLLGLLHHNSTLLQQEGLYVATSGLEAEVKSHVHILPLNHKSLNGREVPINTNRPFYEEISLWKNPLLETMFFLAIFQKIHILTKLPYHRS